MVIEHDDLLFPLDRDFCEECKSILEARMESSLQKLMLGNSMRNYDFNEHKSLYDLLMVFMQTPSDDFYIDIGGGRRRLSDKIKKLNDSIIKEIDKLTGEKNERNTL